jgi:hypothetical protein
MLSAGWLWAVDLVTGWLDDAEGVLVDLIVSLFQGEQGLPLLITSRKCQRESWQIKTDPLQLMGVGSPLWWAILVGGLCGSQQSTRSLTTNWTGFCRKRRRKMFFLEKEVQICVTSLENSCFRFQEMSMLLASYWADMCWWIGVGCSVGYLVDFCLLQYNNLPLSFWFIWMNGPWFI